MCNFFYSLQVRFFLILFVLSQLSSFAQHDSLKTKGEKNSIVNIAKHSPKMAASFSAILPGAGQIYNKKYWKVPVIYAGFVGLGFAFSSAQHNYKKYRTAYVNRVSDPVIPDQFPELTSDQLSTNQSYYHRYRDLYAIGIFAIYVLNIVDAAVDAHLYTFDVSDNLSLRVDPYMERIAATQQINRGLAFTFVFK